MVKKKRNTFIMFLNSIFLEFVLLITNDIKKIFLIKFKE